MFSCWNGFALPSTPGYPPVTNRLPQHNNPSSLSLQVLQLETLAPGLPAPSLAPGPHYSTSPVSDYQLPVHTPSYVPGILTVRLSPALHNSPSRTEHLSALLKLLVLLLVGHVAVAHPTKVTAVRVVVAPALGDRQSSQRMALALVRHLVWHVCRW